MLQNAAIEALEGACGRTRARIPSAGAPSTQSFISAVQVMVVQERLTPVGPNIHANKAGYEEIADTFEAIVDPR